MASLTFDLDDIRPLATHTENTEERRPTFDQQCDESLHFEDGQSDNSSESFWASPGGKVDPKKVPAGFWLVKDQGIYLMPNGLPIDKPEDRRTVNLAYAKGYVPSKDESWYEKARAAAGGDDSCEFIPLQWFKMVEEASAKSLKIRLSKNSMSLVI